MDFNLSYVTFQSEETSLTFKLEECSKGKDLIK